MDAVTLRRDALHNYLMALVRDLIGRGLIRKQRGEHLEEILEREAKTVYREMATDLKDIGLGIVGNVAGGLVEGLFKAMTARR